jgi:hypothetical protein
MELFYSVQMVGVPFCLPIVVLPSVLPAAESASDAEGLLELIGVLILED